MPTQSTQNTFMIAGKKIWYPKHGYAGDGRPKVSTIDDKCIELIIILVEIATTNNDEYQHSLSTGLMSIDTAVYLPEIPGN